MSITLGSRILGSSVPPASALFSILLLVVIVALVGGWRPALTAVAVGLLAQEALFSFPYGSLDNHKPAQLSVLVAFGVIGAAVGILVDDLTRLTEEQAALRRIAILVATEDAHRRAVQCRRGRGGAVAPRRLCPLGPLRAGWQHDRCRRLEPGRGPVPVRCPLVPRRGTRVDARRGSRPSRTQSAASRDGSGPDAGAARTASSRSAAGTPITVDGRPWA